MKQLDGVQIAGQRADTGRVFYSLCLFYLSANYLADWSSSVWGRYCRNPFSYKIHGFHDENIKCLKWDCYRPQDHDWVTGKT